MMRFRQNPTPDQAHRDRDPLTSSRPEIGFLHGDRVMLTVRHPHVFTGPGGSYLLDGQGDVLQNAVLDFQRLHAAPRAGGGQLTAANAHAADMS